VVEDLPDEVIDKCLRLLIPIVKIDAARQTYLVGTQKRQIMMKSTSLIVRMSNGFMGLDAYLDQEAETECLAIWKIMEEKQLSYQ